MMTELETALNLSIAEEKRVRPHFITLLLSCAHNRSLCGKSLTTVVQELDKTLFESYFKPKSAALTAIVRNGVLDPQMDWYETPQPKGTSLSRPSRYLS